MSARIIGDEWATWRKLCVRADVEPVLVEAMRRALYSGAMVLFRVLLTGASEGDAVRPEEMDMMTDLHAEFEAAREEFSRPVRSVPV